MKLFGKYCKDCKVFTDNVEDEALSTIYNMLNHPVFENSKIRIMPDVHAGKGCVIGFSCELNGYVNPEYIGCDIGCQMSTIFFENKILESQYAEFEHAIRDAVPTGFDIHDETVCTQNDFYKFVNAYLYTAHSMWPEGFNFIQIDEAYMNKMLNRIGMDCKKFWHSIGTLGGGNHFIEYGESEDEYCVTVHCGSRNFGMKVFAYWNKIAKNPFDKESFSHGVEQIKRTCTDKTKLPELIKSYKEECYKKNPTGFLTGENMKGYILDMFIAQAYASFNHKIICDIIKEIAFEKFNNKSYYTMNCIHNYISPFDHVMRKGAISAYKGEYLIIPFNMRDGLAICKGKGNPDWNCTAPHGAGRCMSRSAARTNISVDDFTDTMKGIYSTCIGTGTLDESPMAYKPYQEIINNIEPTAEVIYLLKPKINIKASDSMED